jgi:hypothetical protein
MWKITPGSYHKKFKFEVQLNNYFKITDPPYILSIRILQDIRSWLYNNDISNYEHADEIIWYFENESDAIWFVLRWS